jgi:hypothetical protein
MRRYILILIVAISPPLLHAKAVDKEKKSVCSARDFSTLLNRAQIDGITTTLAADNTDITTQIYTEYGLTDNLELCLFNENCNLNDIRTNNLEIFLD